MVTRDRRPAPTATPRRWGPVADEHAFLLPECTEDDVGSFVLPDCGVDLPPQRVTHATYVARRAGIYPILCKVTKHLPMMWGQLVVLSPAAIGGAVEPARSVATSPAR